MLRAPDGAPTAETSPPQSKTQPSSPGGEGLHESVTIAPPAPYFEELQSLQTLAAALPAGSHPHFEAALDASMRAGSRLSELSKLVAQVSGGLCGATVASEQLVQELSTLRAMLDSSSEQQLALQRRVAELEQQRVAIREAGERERRFLTEQYDQFLAAILEDHEQTLLEIQTQRDEARAWAEQRERERDELRVEASQLRAGLSREHRAASTPAPPFSYPPPSFGSPGPLRLDDAELASSFHARSVTPRVPSSAPASFSRDTTRPGVGGPKPSESPQIPNPGPPPASLTPTAPSSSVPPAWLQSAANLPHGQPSPPPIFKQKPAPATRPLIDYSLGEDGVQSELLEGARLSSTPPKK